MNITGLTLDQVREKTGLGLINKSRTATSKKISHVLRDNIINLFNVLITPMIIILVKLGLYKEVISVGALTVANTVIGIIQELKAKMTLDKISLIDVKKCTVIREGRDYEIPIVQIVQGDYVRVKSGDPILADGSMVLANHLEIDESLLTGESDYIIKGNDSKVMSGSFCVSGNGVYTADRVGDESYVNELSARAKQYHKFLSPIQHRVNDIIRILITFAVIMTVLLIMDYAINMEMNPEKVKVIPYRITAVALEKNILSDLIREGDRAFIRSVYIRESTSNYYVLKEGVSGQDRDRILDVLSLARATGKFAVTVRSVSSIIMTLIPQGLVLSITLIFIVGIVRMSRQGALIQKANSIESMAHVNVICMDKTGTLTRNRLTLKEIIPFDKNDDSLSGLLSIFASNSLDRNKTLEALVNALGEKPCETLDAIPFSSQNKFSGLRVRIDGEVSDMVIGASGAVMKMINHIDPDGIEQSIFELSKKGYRVVVFAVKKSDESVPLRESLRSFDYRGLVVFEDEIKPEAGEILDYFQKRNIELKIISGDHPETVKSIAQALNIKNSDRAITGSEMEKLTPDEFERAVLYGTIFARVSPQQKLDIVKVLQRNNRYVAMVGDGVNDALAIKEAYLGISMGSGARVTKDVSEIILIHDTFEIMPGILTQGQIIIQNVKDMAKLFLFKNSYSVILIFITQFLDLVFPFTPQHITLFNFITLTVPSTYIILFAKKGSGMGRDYMKEILSYSITSGTITAILALLIGIYALLSFNADERLYHTYIISTICIMGVFNFIYVYTWPEKARSLIDAKVLITALVCLAFLPGALYISETIKDFFDLKRIMNSDWLTVFFFAVPGMILTYFICKYNILFRLFTPSESKEWDRSGKVERRRIEDRRR
jgi:cation-transporting ATPase E